MKTKLVHSFSTSSFAGLSSSSRCQSAVNLSCQGGGLSNSTVGLVGDYTYNTDDTKSQEHVNEAESPSCLQNWAAGTFRKKHFYRKFPILNWIREYNTSKFIADFIGGLTVGLTILPQGLAYATIAGLPPQYGLYSGFVGCFIYIFFGGTNVVTIGPTAIMSIMTLSYAATKGPQYAILLSFMTGLVTFLMGIFQLGFIVNFFSTPVMSGFTSAAAITICSTQLKSLLGLKFPSDGIIQLLRGTLEHFSEVRQTDALLSIGCVIVLIFMQKMQVIFQCCTKNYPKVNKVIWLISTSRSVIVIIACTIVVSILGNPPAVAVVGDLVPGLPSFQIPPFVYSITKNGTDVEYSIFKLIREDTSALIVIPLLALTEQITVAKAYAGTKRVDASQELITIGLSNMVGSFFSSIPVTGSFSRSVVYAVSGGQSPMGGFVTGSVVLLALQFLTPYFYFIPNSALAAVIVSAVLPTVDLDIIYPMWKTKKMDMIPWALTFIVSLACGLEYGILIGFIISVVFLLYYAARPAVRVQNGFTSVGIEFILLDLDRSLVFPSMGYTSYAINKSGENWAKGYLPVVIDCQHIQFADYTAAQGVSNLFKQFNERHQELILWRVKPSIVRILTTVMEIRGIPFKHCNTEAELESILETCYTKSMDKNKGSNDIRIEFVMAPGDNLSSENSSASSTPQNGHRDYKGRQNMGSHAHLESNVVNRTVM